MPGSLCPFVLPALHTMSRRQFLLRATQAVAATGLPAWAHTAMAAEEALTARSVTLGCSIALTGPLGQAGIEQVAGMKAAFAEVMPPVACWAARSAWRSRTTATWLHAR